MLHPLANLANDLTDKLLPAAIAPRAERLSPSLANWRTLKELPICPADKMLKLEPERTTPAMDIPEPTLANERNDSELPLFIEPNIETCDANLENDLTDKELPLCKKSTMLEQLPMRLKDRTDILLAAFTKFTTEAWAANREIPKILRPEPHRPKLRRLKLLPPRTKS
jgi:hypothetical protein